MQCEAHPEIETDLSCGRCGRPICPVCMVSTPVGPRCPECANLKLLPTYEATPRHYIIATVVGVGFAVAVGFLWVLVANAVPYIAFSTLLAMVIGYVTGELISRVTNRKRVLGLQVLAGVCVVISFVIYYVLADWHSLFNLLGLAIGVALAVSRVR